MERQQLIKKIATFPLIARRLSDDLRSGSFRSLFYGQGIEADRLRPYEIGDDIRMIDWNVSARFGTPYIKTYQEERDQTIFFVLDCSASLCSGGLIQCYDQAVLALALIAFSAEYTGQPIGAVFFDRTVTSVFPARKGRPHLITLINAAIQTEPRKAGSNLGAALATIGGMLKRKSLVVVISDFYSLQWERELRGICLRHEVIAIRVMEPEHLPTLGFVLVRDPETETLLYAPTSYTSFHSAWQTYRRDQYVTWQAQCRRAGAVPLGISTDADAVKYLVTFFKNRK
jgi:uncharacterized protein (DUF58 family)